MATSSALALAQWDVSQIPSMLDKVVIVTGANSGIGFQTTLELARNDATVVLACRSKTRADAAIEAIKKEVPRAALSFLELDLSSLDSVRAFAEAFKKQYDRLDVLVNNAGMMYPAQSHTKDGFETQFAVNHLGHFYLTHLLFDVLRTTNGSRVVNVSSVGHRLAPSPNFDTIATSTRGKWLYFYEYSLSKLCNLLFTYELDRRLRDEGLAMLAVAAHPGVSATNLTPNAVLAYLPSFLHTPIRALLNVLPVAPQSAARGAVPILYAATARSVQSGQYFGPNGFQNFWGRSPTIETSSTLSYSEELARSSGGPARTSPSASSRWKPPPRSSTTVPRWMGYIRYCACLCERDTQSFHIVTARTPLVIALGFFCGPASSQVSWSLQLAKSYELNQAERPPQREMTGEIKKNALAALSSRKTDGSGLRVAIVHAKWNIEIVGALVEGCKQELRKNGVAESDIVVLEVSGAYELPYAASRVIASQKIDAVVAIGCLIKGGTMHFEYICEAVTQGIMRVQLDSGVPVLFGVLTVLNEEQAKERAGLTKNGHNHGVEWAQTAIEMGRLREITSKGGCPMRLPDKKPYHDLHSCPFFTASAWLHVGVISAVGLAASAILKKLNN